MAKKKKASNARRKQHSRRGPQRSCSSTWLVVANLAALGVKIMEIASNALS